LARIAPSALAVGDADASPLEEYRPQGQRLAIAKRDRGSDTAQGNGADEVGIGKVHWRVRRHRERGLESIPACRD